MKATLKIAIMAFIALMAVSSINAQEWTKEQTDVWKVVQDSWKVWQAQDLDAMASFIHEKYQGWSDNDPLPMGKKAVFDWYTAVKDKMKVEYFYLEPARITVIKTAAVVDYYYEFSGTFTAGDKTSSEVIKGKNAEFYVKEGEKWLLIGDMTIHQNDDDD